MAIGDENVTIRINVKADTSAIDRVRRKLAQLCAEADACEETFRRHSEAIDNDIDSQKNFGRQSDRTTQQLRRMGRESNALAKILKTSYKFAFIGAGIETAALALALSSVNGLLATGRFLVNSYRVAMSALAKTAAAAGVALATVAAAQRQYIAAQATGRYGGSFAAASQGLRTLQGDARLASLGMKNLNSAFAAASKNARVTGGTASAIAGLMDFAVASGDIEKGTQAVATLVSLVQKGGAGQKGVLEAAKQLGPEFEKAFKEATKGGKATSAELMRLFSSGELSKKAGLAGGFAATQGTLVGQLKAFMTEMQVMFADLGMVFIEPVQKAFEEIRRIMVRTVTELMPLMANFATGSLIDKVVAGIDKIANFLVVLMQDYVPKTQNFFEKFSAAWNGIISGFQRFSAYLRRFTEASRIMNRFLGGILRAIGGGLKRNFENFAELLVKNEGQFIKFGNSIENLITSIFDFFRALREGFMKALPYITTAINAIAQLVGLFSQLFGMLTSAGGFAAFAGLFAPFFMGGGRRGDGMGGGRRGDGSQSRLSQGAFGRMGAASMVLGAIGLGTATGGALTDELLTAAIIANYAPKNINIPSGRGGGAARGGTTLRNAGARAAGAYVGTQATDYLADVAYRKGGTAASTAVGAVGYGATAAMAMAPLFVTPAAPLAVAGVAVAALIGGIKGFMNDSKYKNQAKDAARSFVDTYGKSVEDALSQNDAAKAELLLKNFNSELQTMADTQVKSGTALKEGNKLWAEQSKVYESGLKTIIARTKDLEVATGMSSDQVRELATAAGVDLSNSMLSLKDILEQTGVATERTAEQFRNELTRSFAESVSAMQTALDTLNAPQVVDEITKAWTDKVLAGTTQAEDTAQMIQGVFQQELLLAGGDPLLALANISKQIGTFDAAGNFIAGEQFTTPGAAFYDPFGAAAATFASTGGQQIYRAGIGPIQQSAARMTAEQIIAGAAGQGKSLGISVDALTASLATMNPSQLALIGQRALMPGAFQAQYAVGPYGATPTGAPDLQTQLTRLGLGPDLLKSIQIQDDSFTKMKDASTTFQQTAGFMKNDYQIFSGAVDKFALSVGTIKDTSTPRRNIVNTLGAHSAFDMSIAGSRTVTSGLRNYGLGSINSDHAAGRAYDLVGQNLGMYQMAVRASGGYAEFHGGSAGRHLHVVPNLNGPVGDSSTPMIAPVSAGATSNSTVTNNITVVQQPGQDTNALVQEIMSQIERANKSKNERY